VKGLLLVDYDNDGWLDIIAYGNGVRSGAIWATPGSPTSPPISAWIKPAPVDALVRRF